MNGEASVLTSQQCAETTADAISVERRTGLTHATVAVKACVEPCSEGIELKILPVTGLLILRATDSREALDQALQKRCGMPLSDTLQSQTNEAYCIRWMSPDSWLLSCPLEEACSLEVDLRGSVTGHLAIVNVSGGYCAMELSGPNVRELLMKSTAYDVHPEKLPPGKVVNTVFAKAQVSLRAIDDPANSSHYELLVRRSFADYVWLWIQQASMEYGLRLVHADVDETDV